MAIGTRATAADATPEPRSRRAATTATSGEQRRHGTRLIVERSGCDALADVEPQSLGLTYWFEPEPNGDPYRLQIRFEGRRERSGSDFGPADRFSVVESVEHIVPGSGPIALTTRVTGIAPGSWTVSAAPVNPRGAARVKRRGRVSSSRRTDATSTEGNTAFAPVIGVRAPGARLGAWPALVATGVVVALVVQALLASRAGLAEVRLVTVSLGASLIGLVGAKVYYLAEHRQGLRGGLTAGMCIQGFVLGAIGALVVGALLGGIALGPALDVSAPGLLLAMGIGRLGCFFGGCCAGRPSGGRWALWSSDRRLGARRIPVQLAESVLAATTGLAALALAWSTNRTGFPAIFVGFFALFVVGRQMLFPYRAIPRHTRIGRPMTIAAGLAAAAIALGLAVVGA